jgi:hypothetical protein
MLTLYGDYQKGPPCPKCRQAVNVYAKGVACPGCGTVWTTHQRFDAERRKAEAQPGSGVRWEQLSLI